MNYKYGTCALCKKGMVYLIPFEGDPFEQGFKMCWKCAPPEMNQKVIVNGHGLIYQGEKLEDVMKAIDEGRL